MPWNGSGTYEQKMALAPGPYTGNGVCVAMAGDGDAVIYATELDSLFEDHQDAINSCLAKNGENAATGNLDGGTVVDTASPT
jgi:hypothetical protein